jgi:hypothetical protein
VNAAEGVREADFAAWWSGAWEALPADEDVAHEAFCAGWEAGHGQGRDDEAAGPLGDTP